MSAPTLGVVVARFQVDGLTKGHIDLINYALAQNDCVMVVLGSGRGRASAHNPLSYELRKAMVHKAYPNLDIAELLDDPSDEEWSKSLDQLVRAWYPDHRVRMYGSRNSFLEVYSGHFETVLFQVRTNCSGTQARAKINGKVSREFLAGIIYNETNRPVTCYPTVDVACVRPDTNQVLLVSKATDHGKLRFVGGFVDPNDTTYLEAARREFHEETTNVEASAWRQIGSHRIDDWRYRGSGYSIMTSLFCCQYNFGRAEAADDVVSAQWVDLSEMMDRLVEEHKPLGQMLEQYLNEGER